MTISPAVKKTAIWCLRLFTGISFIISGWAKSVDPAGFVYKIGEYLNAWQIGDVFNQDIILVTALILSLSELITGVLLATGCLRRSTPIFALLMMTFMLPLTIYLVIADPVSDCGCFGDFIVISNPLSLIKNILITAALIALLYLRDQYSPLYRPGVQWLVIVLTGIYGLVLSFVGWNFQPVTDFRPYPVGSKIYPDDDSEESIPHYIYSKDGQEQSFALDALPDSTWTFVRAAKTDEGDLTLALFDGEYEVTEEILGNQEGDMLLLVVNEPGLDYLMRARMANALNTYITNLGGQMIAAVAASGEALEQWIELARPEFDVYSASDTSLKQLARGASALVMIRDGVILWKRNFANIDTNIPDSDTPDALDSMVIVDDGRIARIMCLSYILGMLILYLISFALSKREKAAAKVAE